jgi:hypothetical protein
MRLWSDCATINVHGTLLIKRHQLLYVGKPEKMPRTGWCLGIISRLTYCRFYVASCKQESSGGLPLLPGPGFRCGRLPGPARARAGAAEPRETC